MPKLKIVNGEEPRKMSTLSMVNNYRLMKMIVDEYSLSGLDDGAFAIKATEALGVPVNRAHIINRRKELDIPSNTARGNPNASGGPDTAVLAAQALAQAHQIADLTERVAKLEVWVNATFPSKGPKAPMGR